MARTTTPLSAADTAALDAVAGRQAMRRALEVEDLSAALEWALDHLETAPEPYAAAASARPVVNSGWLAARADEYAVQADEANLVFDDPFIPVVAWHAYAPFAAAMGRSTLAGRRLITDALVLHFRLPRLWNAVVDGHVEVWRARRIAQAVRMRPADVASFIDATVTPIADSIGSAKLDALIDEAMMRLHAEERELELADARESWGVEFSEGRIGDHRGEMTYVSELHVIGNAADLKAFEATASKIARLLGLQANASGDLVEPLEIRRARAIGILAEPAAAAALLAGDLSARPSGHELVVHVTAEALTGVDPIAHVEGPLKARLAQQVVEWLGGVSHFTVLPVIDLNEPEASASRQVTEAMGRRARLRVPTCAFPYCDRPSRNCDIDHLVPSGNGGATSDENLVPLCRHHHRLKTHAGWSYTQIEPRVWLWRDPHGRQYLRDHHSTRDASPPASSGSPPVRRAATNPETPQPPPF